MTYFKKITAVTLALLGALTIVPADAQSATWVQQQGQWVYYNADGQLAKDAWIGDYYVGSSGTMATNQWITSGSQWYYVGSSGKMLSNQWHQINGIWYYFNADGTMASSMWVGRYYLNPSGKMAASEWIYDNHYASWFYLNADGRYAEQEWVDQYYMKSGGYMAKSEWIIDAANHWYYVDYLGFPVTNFASVNGKWQEFSYSGVWLRELPTAPAKNTNHKVIFLDPGHGGKERGAYYFGTPEKELTLQVYKKLRPRLEALGYTVLSSRSDDSYVDFVTQRSEMVNQTNADFFISLHFNASGHGQSGTENGIQTYTYLPERGIVSRINKELHDDATRLNESRRLASDVHSALLSSTGANDAGLLSKNLAVLRETNKPAILIEMGYMDNATEFSKITTDSYQDRIVDGIVQGITEYYNGK